MVDCCSCRFISIIASVKSYRALKKCMVVIFFTNLSNDFLCAEVIWHHNNHLACYSTSDSSLINFQSFKEASRAMTSIRPVMLVTDESSDSWYSELQHNAIPSLRWHVSLGSSSSDFVNKRDSMQFSCKLSLIISIRYPSNTRITYISFSKLLVIMLLLLSSILPVLTADILKGYFLRSLPFTHSWAPEGAVIICFTSGKSLFLLYVFLFKAHMYTSSRKHYFQKNAQNYLCSVCHVSHCYSPHKFSTDQTIQNFVGSKSTKLGGNYYKF